MTRRRQLGLLLGLPLLVAVGGFVWFLGQVLAEPTDPGRPTEGIVVLTGGAERVQTGLALLEAGAAPRLLVSGAAPGLTLAELARAHGREPAALDGRVELGHDATTTLGNARETAAWARRNRLRSIRVVTAGYHMPRALLELRRALPRTALVPHPVGPAVLRQGGMPLPRTLRLLTGEYAKYAVALAGLTVLGPARESR